MITKPGPTFTQSLETVSITSGTKTEWILPDIDPGKGTLTEVRFDADPLISQYLKYKSVTNSVIYDGELISSLSDAKFVRISFTLVNNFGENLYAQAVSVQPNPESLSTPEPADSEVASESIDEDNAAAENSNSAK